MWGEGHVMMDAETVVLQLHAGERQGLQQPLKPGRGKEGSSPRTFRGGAALPTLILAFQAPELGDNIFLLLLVTPFVVPGSPGE